ncbi:ATP phosphoribosyltransferase regulatory subunit [Sulfurivirga sp.]|uniref:ATP phosphoribosyltransferase regulatory subunit n=1 Tax=Sulfurivirga sp. TaxID=2614236 RepID=UPI0025DDBEFA|nr:ATP phosphoribosyltransferase regulatory subunit [Sulfurivirga sp.]
MTTEAWFTPEGIEDLLPEQAEKLEFYRRELVDLFAASGYALVQPPLAEYVEALLTGTAQDLRDDTCVFVDRESGRQMGVRADMTPQVARIALSRLEAGRGHPLRLCYAGEVLRAHYNRATGSRSPYQVGIELFNVPGTAGDQEALLLLVEAMEALGLTPMTLSLGHAGLVRGLLEASGLTAPEQADVLDMLRRKARPEYEAWLAAHLDDIHYSVQALFTDWLLLAGEAESVLEQARALLQELPEQLHQLQALADVVMLLREAVPDVRLFVDLAEVRGYQYHTGVTFATYVTDAHGQAVEVANGGRYDGMGREFGAVAPATGFSLDLRAVLDMLPPVERTGERIWAPMQPDAALYEKVGLLRAEGWEVLWCETVPQGAGRYLENIGGEWVVRNDKA